MKIQLPGFCGAIHANVFFCQFREVYEQKADQLTESRLDAESNINITY